MNIYNDRQDSAISFDTDRYKRSLLHEYPLVEQLNKNILNRVMNRVNGENITNMNDMNESSILRTKRRDIGKRVQGAIGLTLTDIDEQIEPQLHNTINTTKQRRYPLERTLSTSFLSPQSLDGSYSGQNITNINKIPRIRVAIRKRPLSDKERTRGEIDIISMDELSHLCTVHEPKVRVDQTKYTENHRFVFDEVFEETSTNENIYQQTCRPQVEFAMNFGRATCFAYGQTGSGKTHTMMGPSGGKGIQDGQYSLACHDLFNFLELDKYKDLQIWASYFEIYKAKIFDLQNYRKRLVSMEDGNKEVVIVGLYEHRVYNVSEQLHLVEHGNSHRMTGITGANSDSSRSHAIQQITIRQQQHQQQQQQQQNIKQQYGRFSFIDLAGSERGADTNKNDRKTRIEGAAINQSQLALKECIRAMDIGEKRQPFRGSVQTQVLKDSFVGNSKTVMIANISPCSSSVEHTLNTLRYADRVKEQREDNGSNPLNGQSAYMPHMVRRPINNSSPSSIYQQRNKNIYTNDINFRTSQQCQSSQPNQQADIYKLNDENDIPLVQNTILNNTIISSNRNQQNNSLRTSSNTTIRTRIGTNGRISQENGIKQPLIKDKDTFNDDTINILDQIVDKHRINIDSYIALLRKSMTLLKDYKTSGTISNLQYIEGLECVAHEQFELSKELQGTVQNLHLRQH